MKLRNKKSGEIGILLKLKEDDEVEILTDNSCYLYNSLAELNAEWEDYEEPEGYFYIRDGGNIDYYRREGTITERHKSIGNYFETEKEAEKAVEKLKAWKRLKDKGFRFTGIKDDEPSQELITQCAILCEANIYHLEKDADFLLLFGGEE